MTARRVKRASLLTRLLEQIVDRAHACQHSPASEHTLGDKLRVEVRSV